MLVDKLWPRGLSKEKAKIKIWERDVAPSDELRKWFGHDPRKWVDFRRRYRKEINKSEALKAIIKLSKKSKVTLLYAAKDVNHNNAIVLAEIIKSRSK